MKKTLKILTAASLLLTIATAAAMTANASEANVTRGTTIAKWTMSAYPGDYKKESVIVLTEGDECGMHSESYSSTPSVKPIYFSTSVSYDKVAITGTDQYRFIHYKPDVKADTRVAINYEVNAGESRVFAYGTLIG